MASERRRTSSDGSSLGSMARHFLEHIRLQPDGLVDLNEASKRLNARKRRVYDVTNVLEGVELLEKTSKNIVRWIAPKSDASPCTSQAITQLKREIQKMEEDLRNADLDIEAIYGDLRTLQDSEGDWMYVASNDLQGLKALQHRRCFYLKMPENAQSTRVMVSPGIHRFMAECTEGEIVLLDGSRSKEHTVETHLTTDEASKENRTKRRSSS